MLAKPLPDVRCAEPVRLLRTPPSFRPPRAAGLRGGAEGEEEGQARLHREAHILGKHTPTTIVWACTRGVCVVYLVLLDDEPLAPCWPPHMPVHVAAHPQHLHAHSPERLEPAAINATTQLAAPQCPSCTAGSDMHDCIFDCWYCAVTRHKPCKGFVGYQC